MTRRIGTRLAQTTTSRNKSSIFVAANVVTLAAMTAKTADISVCLAISVRVSSFLLRSAGAVLPTDQLRSCKSQGFRIGIQPKHCSTSIGPLGHHRQSASPTTQGKDSLPILNARLLEQRILECSLTRSSADNGVVEARQPAISQCRNVRVRRWFHVLPTLLWETRAQSERSLDFSLCSPCRAQPTSAPSQATVCSLHWDARRVKWGRDLNVVVQWIS